MRYDYDEDKGTIVHEHSLSTLVDYNHDQWENAYLNQPKPQQDSPEKDNIPKHPPPKKPKKMLFPSDSPQDKDIILKGDNAQEGTSNDSEKQFSPAKSMKSKKAEVATQALENTRKKGQGSLAAPHKALKRVFTGCSQPDSPANNIIPKHPAPKKPLKEINIQSDSTQGEVIIFDEEENTEESTNPSNGWEQQLSSTMCSASTRAEIAALASVVPPVASNSGFLTLALDSHLVFTNPFRISQRPCRALITQAETLLADERKKGNDAFGVVINGVGQFSEQGLRILKKFCAISETQHNVNAEARWLAQLNCTQRELGLLQAVLWNKPARSPILVCDHKAIDVLSFSDLVEERYIDSFVIDVSICKYIEENYSQQQENTLYLPTDFFQWMQVQDKQFKLRKLRERSLQVALFENVSQILVPVFMANHWGLIYVNISAKQLYFDDGLTSVVPPVALPFLKDSLDLLLELYPHHLSLQTKFWHSIKSFRRFGMPSQLPIDNRMIGVGRCGIGVIMAARDFIRDGPETVNNVKWRYSHMHNHRKELMMQILKWAGYDI